MREPQRVSTGGSAVSLEEPGREARGRTAARFTRRPLLLAEDDEKTIKAEQSRDETIAALPVLLYTVVEEAQTSEAMGRYCSIKAFIKKLMPPVDFIEIIRSFLLLGSGGSLDPDNRN